MEAFTSWARSLAFGETTTEDGELDSGTIGSATPVPLTVIFNIGDLSYPNSESLFQVLIEPADRPLLDVLDVVGLANAVPLVLVNDELCRDPEGLQCVPELVALRRRHLGVAVAVEHERGSLDVLDERDRRRTGVDVRVFVDGFPEVRHHPLVDAVLSVVALPVDDARPGHGGLETPGLCHGPHRHVAAVAPSNDAQPVLVDRRLP